jgi:hypothetical protein
MERFRHPVARAMRGTARPEGHGYHASDVLQGRANFVVESARADSIMGTRRRDTKAESCEPINREPAPAMKRAKGIEPSPPAWKAGALPLSYARVQSR